MHTLQTPRYVAGFLAARPCAGVAGLLALLLPGTG